MTTEFLRPFINKQVSLRFAGQGLRFDLSQSLFSSFDIDAGSRLLLKTVAQQVDLTAVAAALDVGCGVGVLGLCVQKVNPQVQVTLQDRDALAVAFAAHNARLNKLRRVTVQGGLAFQGTEGRHFDLILSNLPGKAGEPALQAMLAQMAAHLTENGAAAVVVVRPLADRVAAALAQQQSRVTYQEEGAGYVVFHFRGGDGVADATLTPYLRGQVDFAVGGQQMTLQTAYNLPEFDNLGYDTALAVTAVRQEQVSGRVLIWNPGQGHLPVYLRLLAGQAVTHYTLASRDALSLQICALNLTAQGVADAQITSLHSPDFTQVAGEFDWVCVFPDTDAGVPWQARLLPHGASLLASQGRLLVTAKSTHVFRMLESGHSLAKQADRKKQGYRTLLLRRRP